MYLSNHDPITQEQLVVRASPMLVNKKLDTNTDTNKNTMTISEVQ